MGEKKFRWERKSSELLQFWPKPDFGCFLVPQSADSFFIKLRGKPEIRIPEPTPFAPLESRKIINAGIVTHHAGFYQHLVNSGFIFAAYTLGGAADASFEKKKIRLKKGDFFAVPADGDFAVSASRKWESLWFHIGDSPEWRASAGCEIFARKAANLKQIENAARGYETEAYAPSPNPDILESYAELIARLLRRDFRGSPKNRLLDGFLLEFARRPSIKITASQLAQRLKISTYELDKLCVFERGAKFAKIALEIRMNAARSILRNGATAAQTAKLVGFSDAFSFSKAFKKFNKITPKSFKKESAMANGRV